MVCGHRSAVGTRFCATRRNWIHRQAHQSDQPRIGQLDFSIRNNYDTGTGAGCAGKNRCGSCMRCITACPTNAITAPFELDARRCISYLTIELKGSIPIEFRCAIGNRIYGCDDCLAACPWNRFAKLGKMMEPFAKTELASPDLIELLKLNDEHFRENLPTRPFYERNGEVF